MPARGAPTASAGSCGSSGSTSTASGAASTDDLERWRLTDPGKDYLKQSARAWGRAEVAHARTRSDRDEAGGRACTFYTKLPAP